MVAGQFGLKSSRPLSQLGPGSTRQDVLSEHSASYMIYDLFCIIFWAKSQMNIKQFLTNNAIKLLIEGNGCMS